MVTKSSSYQKNEQIFIGRMHAGKTRDMLDQSSRFELRFWSVEVDPCEVQTFFGRVDEDGEIIKDDSTRR